MSAAPKITLSIGLDQEFATGGNPHGTRSGYVGRIIDVTPGRPADERDQRDLIIPIEGEQFKSVELKAGDYIIEAYTPSGELLDEKVSLSPDAAAAAPVRLGKRRKFGREMAWQVASGNINQTVRLPAAFKNDIGHVRKASSRFLPLLVVALILAAGLGALFYIQNLAAPEGPAISAPSEAAAVDATTQMEAAADATEPGAGRGPGDPALRRIAPRIDMKAQAAPAMAPASRAPVLNYLGVLALLLSFMAVLYSLRGVLRGGSPFGAGLGRIGRTAPLEPKQAPPASDAPVAEVRPALSAAVLFRLDARASWKLVEAACQGSAAVADLIDHCLTKSPLAMREAAGFVFYDVEPCDPLLAPDFQSPVFAYVPAAGSAGQILRVPLPWRTKDNMQSGFEIAASANHNSSFSAASAIKDTSISTILGYMASGRLREAELLVRDAENLLNHKYSNPMAAALGAYVLLASCRSTESGKNWRPWIGNLYRDFPLPDGAILQGWNLLQQQAASEDVQRARQCFVEAVRRGIPLYAEGVKLLQNGLAMFASQAGEDEHLKKAIDLTDKLATRCNPSQAFTTISVRPA